MSTRERDRVGERELLIPVGEPLEIEDGVPSASSAPIIAPPPSSAHRLHPSGTIGASSSAIRSWASKKFMTGCVILCPIAITFYSTWWFVRFVDGFFSPVYSHLGINLFGLGFITSISFIFLVGVFMSSWVGASLLGLGEWFIKKMPLVCHIYSASKQISTAISSDQSSGAFKEVVIIRHPRIGEYAIGFITSNVVLQWTTGNEELSCVYVPTNHLYLGEIFLINSKDVIRPTLSVREAIEIFISGGTSIPTVLSTTVADTTLGDHVRVAKPLKPASAQD